MREAGEPSGACDEEAAEGTVVPDTEVAEARRVCEREARSGSSSSRKLAA